MTPEISCNLFREQRASDGVYFRVIDICGYQIFRCVSVQNQLMGFLFFCMMSMGLFLVAHRAAGAPLLIPLTVLTSLLLLLGLDAPPSSWVIIPHDRGSSLLVAIDHLLYLTDKSQCNKQVCDQPS